MSVGRKRLLIFDDHPEELREVVYALTKCGVDVSFAKSKVEFDARLTEKPYDALLLDITVPRTPGKYIQSDAPHPSIDVSREAAVDFRRAFPRSPILLNSAYVLTQTVKYSDITGIEVTPVGDIKQIAYILEKLGFEKPPDELRAWTSRRAGGKGKYGLTTESDADMDLPLDDYGRNSKGYGK